jgi:hypothetical protein
MLFDKEKPAGKKPEGEDKMGHLQQQQHSLVDSFVFSSISTLSVRM